MPIEGACDIGVGLKCHERRICRGKYYYEATVEYGLARVRLWIDVSCVSTVHVPVTNIVM